MELRLSVLIACVSPRCNVYGAVMSRAQVPPVKVHSTVANSPTLLFTGVKFASMQFVMVYSGFEADSVVPLGLITNVVVPVPTHDARMASTSAAPYERKNVIATSTVSSNLA